MTYDMSLNSITSDMHEQPAYRTMPRILSNSSLTHEHTDKQAVVQTTLERFFTAAISSQDHKRRKLKASLHTWPDDMDSAGCRLVMKRSFA